MFFNIEEGWKSSLSCRRKCLAVMWIINQVERNTPDFVQLFYVDSPPPPPSAFIIAYFMYIVLPLGTRIFWKQINLQLYLWRQVFGWSWICSFPWQWLDTHSSPSLLPWRGWAHTRMSLRWWSTSEWHSRPVWAGRCVSGWGCCREWLWPCSLLSPASHAELCCRVGLRAQRHL